MSDRGSSQEAAARAGRVLDELAAMLGVSCGAGARSAIDAARAHAGEICAAAANEEADVGLASTILVADVVTVLCLEQGSTRRELDRLVSRSAQVVGLSESALRLGICLRVLRSPGFLQLPPPAALAGLLQLAVDLTAAVGMSVWAPGRGGRPRCIAAAGAGQVGRSAVAEVTRTLRGGAARERGHLRAVPINGRGSPAGALLARALPTHQPFVLAVARDLADAVAPVLEKEALSRREPAGRGPLELAAERRLARFGLDLHDGALQDMAAVAEEVRYLRRQLDSMLAGDDRRDRLLDHVDDVEAGILALDASLRGAIQALEVESVQAGRSLRETLEHELDGARRRGVTVSLDAVGRDDMLTDSQRIALVRVAQEALANSVRHGGASTIRISLELTPSEVRLAIVDDGRGFDVEKTIAAAARQGRLGVVGMNERIRMLGGVFELDSRPGGPTRVAVALPAWQPAGETTADRLRATGTAERR